jgi:hypothetical protein
MSLQVNDPRSRGRSKSPSGSIRDRSTSRASRRRPSPSPARSPATGRTAHGHGSDENLRSRSRGTGATDRGSRRPGSRYDLSDSGDEARRTRYRRGERRKDRYYHSEDSGEESQGDRGRLTPGYVAARESSRGRRPAAYGDGYGYRGYSGASGSDDSLDDGLIYGDEDLGRRGGRLSPSPRPASRRSRRRSSSRVRGSGSGSDEDIPGRHPSYAAPGRYKYADPAQYAYANPGAARLASYTGAGASAAPQSNWAPVPECEMPGFASPSHAQAERQSMPGAFPPAQSDGSAAQNPPAFPMPQYMTLSQQQQQNLYAPQSGRPSSISTSYAHVPSAGASSSHQRTSSSDAGPRPIYANPAPFQYAQVGPNVKYGSKTAEPAIPYTYSTTPQFSKPPANEPQYVEIAPGRRNGGHSHSQSASSANNLSAGGPDPGRRPASPMLEPYKGTYQSISPMPSPIVPSSKVEDDISDLEPLDAPSGAGKPKKDKRKPKEDKERSEKKKSRSKRDRSSTRHDRNDSQDQQAMVLVSPSSRKRVTFYDPVPDALEMRDALSHSRNIDTKTLIYILPHLASEDLLTLRKEYKNHVKLHGKGINMAKHLRLKLGGSAFGKACYATALGRWESEAYWANCYYQSSTSRRELLIESLTGRSNVEVSYIKDSFRDSRYMNSLERCMGAELKADKFRTAILLSLEGRRQSEREPIDPDLVHDDVRELHRALTSRDGGETAMVYIIVLRSDNHLRELLRYYEKRYRRNFAREMIAKSQNLVVSCGSRALRIARLTDGRAKPSRTS